MMTIQKVYRIVAVVLVLACGAELAGVHMHAPHWWPLPFGYDIFFGFFGCWTLIVISKIILTNLIQRDEDYYTKDGGADNE